jgi:hypothetical protein
MKIIITTYDDFGNEVISRSYYHDNESASDGLDDAVYDILEDSKETICSDCKGSGKVVEGEFGDEVEKDCHCVQVTEA